MNSATSRPSRTESDGNARARENRKARWEALCLRCGICCYEKRFDRMGRPYADMEKPCKYLDPASRLCTIYEKRYSLCPECRPMTIAAALFCCWLPRTCGYVKRYRPWRTGER